MSDSSVGSGVPRSSVGDDPLSSVVDSIDEVTDGGQFVALEGGSVRCVTCRCEFSASGVHASNTRRLEGESDPSDMTLLLPVVCPDCGTSGSLVLQYGPEASAADADVLVSLSRP